MIRHGGLTEKFAHELEMCLIQLYKPQLTNRTDGGEGISGHKHSKNTRDKRAKTFIIKTKEGTVILRDEYTLDKRAQEFLGKSGSNISSLLTDSSHLLFFKVNGNIHYLEYEDQTLAERAKLLDRNIIEDLEKVKAKKEFQSEITVEKSGKHCHLKGYKTYFDAGRMLGLSTKSKLGSFSQMVVGKIKTASGYRLVI